MTVKTMMSIKLMIEKAHKAWYTKHGEAEITQQVNKLLDSRKQTILAQLLGFRTDSWGRVSGWEVDNCNGRSGESAVGISSQRIVTVALDTWIAKNDAEITETLEAKCMPAFKRHLTSHLSNQFNQRFVTLTTEKIDALISEKLEKQLEDAVYDISLKLLKD